jgi:gliding motility-associated-like protein
LDSTICENEIPLIWNGLTFNAAGTQTLTSSSANGCDSLIIMNVQVLSIPQISISGGDTYCQGEVVNSITAQITGQSPFSISYIVDGIPFNISSNTLAVNLGDSAGTYTLVSISDDNCTNSSLNESETIQIFPVPQPPNAFGDSSYCINSQVDSLNAIALPGATVNWYNTEPFQTPFEVGASALPEITEGPTTYYVTQEVNGCTSPADSVLITFEICDIIVPTAFTPDGDNTNDFWNLGNIDALYPNNLVTIYNRWGNLIYQSQPGKYQSKPWDGSHNQEPMPVGSYYFIIEFGVSFKGNESGIVTIVK